MTSQAARSPLPSFREFGRYKLPFVILLGALLIATLSKQVSQTLAFGGGLSIPQNLQLNNQNSNNQNQNLNNQNLNLNQNLNNQNNHQRAKPFRGRKPESSSSMFAELEDLSDSNIRAKGKLAAPAETSTGSSVVAPKQPVDFDRLIERLAFSAGQRVQDLEPPQQVQLTQQQQHHQQLESGEANLNQHSNRTSMKFFRNNKTFASVVFTNEKKPQRKLINCHLVDLEKHSPDVVIFESKYDIRTVDIEFEDMMLLIESCTEIARFRPPLRPMQSSGGNGQQQQQQSSQAQQQQQQQQQAQLPSAPVAIVQPPATLPVLIANRAAPQQQQQQQLSSSTQASNSIATYQSVMSDALGKELTRLGPTIDDSNKLDIPHSTPPQVQSVSRARSMRRARRRLANESRQLAGVPMRQLARHGLERRAGHSVRFRAMGAAGMPAYSGELLQHNGHSHPASLLSETLAKVGESSKRLVLGEVTPPPSVVEGQKGSGIKEALQEITSYDTTDLLAIWRGILPGTNWCGMGDRATSYNDLGFETDIDICCRAHDFCPIRLSAFSSGYGLFNWSFYTRSHCTCDQNFLNCLQRADSPLGSVVMRLYFSVMKTTCLHDNETSAALAPDSKSTVMMAQPQPQQPQPQLQQQHLKFHISTHSSSSSFNLRPPQHKQAQHQQQ